MKSFTVIAITAALASAASAFKHEKPGIPELTRPGVEVETRPPVIVVETVTLTKSWAPKETGSGSWKSHKYGGKGYHHDDKDEDEEDDDEDDKDDDKKGWDKDDDDDDKKEWKGIHANSFAPKASFGAAQASSFVNSMTSAAASRATSIASKASSAAASASASVTATHASAGNNLRVGGALVAGAAGFAAYLLL